MQSFKSLKKSLLSTEVEGQLRQSINSGIYKPGDKFPSERELADQFEVSRVTVREALRNLQNRGLHAGGYVSEPRGDAITKSFENLIALKRIDFAHFIDARLYIEPQAARVAAGYATDEDIETLTALLDEAEYLAKVSMRKARLANERFHCEVSRISRNPIIMFIAESITQVYLAYLIEQTQGKFLKTDILRLGDEHRIIIDSIRDGDEEGAFNISRKHLLGAYSVYSRIIPGDYDKDVDKRIIDIETAT